MKIVFKCDNPDCTYPDTIEYYPVDDNIPCACGGTQWGHWKNKEEPKVDFFSPRVQLDTFGMDS